MGLLRKVKALGVGVVAVGVGGYMGFEYLGGEGAIHVMAPYDSAIAVSVDGAEVTEIAPNSHHTLKIAQGTHTVSLTNSAGKAREYAIEVSNGFYAALLPATDAQCFADLDVKKTYYNGSDSPELPKLDGTFANAEPIDIAGHHYFTEDELPQSLKSSRSANLVLEIPCDLVGKSQDEVLAVFNFTL